MSLGIVAGSSRSPVRIARHEQWQLPQWPQPFGPSFGSVSRPGQPGQAQCPLRIVAMATASGMPLLLGIPLAGCGQG